MQPETAISARDRPIGKEVTASWIGGARRLTSLSPGDRSVLHLHYRNVVSRPMDAIEAVYRHCGLTLSHAAEYGMVRWLGSLNAADRAPRRYDLPEFGLNPDWLHKQFRHYTDRFRVQIEPE
jgi:hypothetical protein